MKNKTITLILLFSALSSYTIDNFEKNNIAISLFDYNSAPDQQIFPNTSITAKQLLSQDTYPVRIQISNKSNKPIVISLQSFNAKIVNHAEVAKKLHYHEIIRPVLTHLIGGNVLGAGIGFFGLMAGRSMQEVITLAAIVGCSSLFANIYHWYNLRQTNKEIDSTLCSTSCLHKPFIIQPTKWEF